MVRGYQATYGLPTLITRASNNFGPYQYPQKFLPVLITRALDDQPIPLYGDGRQRRDWLYMDDHYAALEEYYRRNYADRAGLLQRAMGNR